MILIIISWIYILFTTINLGFWFDQLMGLKNKNFVVTSILGLFCATIIASLWAIFGRINIEFHVFLLVFNSFIFLNFRKKILQIYSVFFGDLKCLSKLLKIYLISIFIMIVAQCSSVPFVIDNESYYIQTIKWINEYGFVKGIVNLHLFLGQTSGWHITQSVFNFSFLYSNFNDISGFMLLLGIVFSIQKLNEYYNNKNFNYLIIGLFPIYSLFYFQFISAPSPDISVFVMSFIILFYFIENFKKCSAEIFNLMVVFILFTLYIKNTTLVLLFIPIVLLFQNYKELSKNLLKSISIATLVLLLFVIKNMIICGTPIFPSKLFTFLTMDYAIPDSIEFANYNQIKYCGYFIDLKQYNSMSAFDLFLRWLTLPKLNRLFNKISVILILFSPFFIYKFQNKKSFWILYFLMFLQLVLLFATSPQYRFFMNFILFFSIFCFTCIFNNKQFIYSILQFSLLPTLFVLLVPMGINQFSNQKYMNQNSNFSTKYFIFPHENSKNSTLFEVIELGNFKYNSPIQNDFFWGNGNGNLPCVNKKQIEFYKKYYNIIPQKRTNDLKDGFYAKNISK